jgi:O-antigen/teichoic acid export membrane protein
MIVTVLTTFFLYWIFSQQVKLPVHKLNKAVLLTEGVDMMKMGSLISITGLWSLATAYAVQLYVSHAGGIEQVGLFTAGFAIINTYVGMIFTAMGTDYFPRLSGMADKKDEINIIVNQQIEIAILLLTPVITAFIVYVNLVVLILYAPSFVAINDMILWAALGMFFKAASWAIAFMFLAKGDSKLFFWSELFANIYLLGLNIAGYTLFGLTGLGLSFLLTYMIYSYQVYIIAKRKFQFEFQPVLVRNFCLQLLLAVLCFIVMKYVPNPFNYLIGTIVILIAGWHTFKELDKRINLKAYLQKISSR